MTIELLSPGLVLIAGGLLLPLVRGRAREGAVLALPLVALYLSWAVPEGAGATVAFLDRELVPVRADALARLFATIFAVMAFAGGLFACRQASALELSAAFVYAGSAIGAAFAGDLITLFVFWELMAIGSTLVIWSAGSEAAGRASLRYLLVHLLGGVVLMAGIAAHVHETGSILFDAMRADGLGRWLILAGFLLNAGAPPLSAWLPDAYPEASPSGAVFLSAFTTKTAVYVLLRGFPGETVLVFLGLYMIFYGIVYALLENDMRRILAYSIVNQVGFMVCGAGIGTALAVNGAAAHAFTHIIYKALLLMSAGAVLHMTGRRRCSELGGLVQSMPLTAACGIVGALSISAFPLTSGFVSKSMISQASADGHMLAVWLLLQAASAGVFLHAGIKFPWFVFFQKDSGLRPPDPPMNMRAAMVLFAFLCLALGMAPGPLYAILPHPVDFVPYTGSHVVGQLQLLLFAGLAFFVMLPQMKRTLTISLDWDWFYRRLGPRLAGHAARATSAWIGAAEGAAREALGWLLARPAASGGSTRPWPTSGMVLVVTLVLGVTLVLYYL